MRLIDADALKVYHGINVGRNYGGLRAIVFKRDIDNALTIEAEPTKHGRWLIGAGENGEPIGTYCSECGWSWERNIAAIQLNKVFSRIETPRCPYCGARMD